MVEKLTEEQIAEFKEAYSLYDREEDGMITTKELGTVMRSLGLNPSETDLQNMVSEVDAKGDGCIDFTQFLNLMASKVGEVDTDEELINSFRVFDNADTGYIPAAKLRHVMSTLGEKMSEEDVNQMILDADLEKNGFINYKEFSRIMLAK